MKIDLHLHSLLSSYDGDSIKWTSDSEVIRALFNKKVQGFAFTDHNRFDAKNYCKFRELIANYDMVIYPGVEIDVLKDNATKGHILYVFEETLTESQLVELEKTINSSFSKRGVRAELLQTVFQNYLTIAVPHVGKTEYFTYQELTTIQHDAIEITSSNHPNYRKWLAKANNKSVVAFSDTHVWKKYPQQNMLYTAIEYDGTLKDLKQQLSLQKNYTKEIK